MFCARLSCTSSSLLGLQRRKCRVDVGFERVVEQVRDEAKRGLGNNVDDLRIAVTGGAHSFDVRVFDVTARPGDLVGELKRRIGLWVR